MAEKQYFLIAIGIVVTAVLLLLSSVAAVTLTRILTWWNRVGERAAHKAEARRKFYERQRKALVARQATGRTVDSNSSPAASGSKHNRAGEPASSSVKSESDSRQ